MIYYIPVAEIVSGEKGVPETFAQWRGILEAYQSRGQADVCGETVDFADARGRILCSLTGHEHAERQTFRNGIWHITEPCDAAYSDYIAGSAPWCVGLPKKDKGCYDADRMGKTRNPDNKYQYFCKYFNDVAKITDDGTMTARKVGESVAVATTPDMRRAIFAVEVRSRPASQRSCPSGETALRDF